MSDTGGDGRAAGWRRPPSAAERLALRRDPALRPGLCVDCLHLRILRSGRSRFVRCLLAESEAGYPRYPPLPVIACEGHRRWDGGGPGPGDGDG